MLIHIYFCNRGLVKTIYAVNQSLHVPLTRLPPPDYRPFLSILNVKDVSPSVQDMVVRCVSQLIQSQWTNVRSGWSNIFLALYLAASLPDEAVVELAFDSCSFIINNIIPNSFYILAESFPVGHLELV